LEAHLVGLIDGSPHPLMRYGHDPAGIFLTIPTVPHTHELLYLVLALVHDAADTGKHEVTVSVVDPDGEVLADDSCDVEASGELGPLEMVVALPGIPFRALGPHDICLAVDGSQQSCLRLNLVRLDSPSET